MNETLPIIFGGIGGILVSISGGLICIWKQGKKKAPPAPRSLTQYTTTPKDPS